MEGSDDESAAFSMFSKKVKTTPSKAKETKEIVLQREKHVVKEAEERLTFSGPGSEPVGSEVLPSPWES